MESSQQFIDALVLRDHLGATRQDLGEGQINLEGVDPAPPGFSVKETYKVGPRVDQVFKKPYPKTAHPPRKNRGGSTDQSRDASRGRRARGFEVGSSEV